MALPSLKGFGIQQQPDFNKALDIGHAPYASMVPRQLVDTVFQMESSGGTNRANEKFDLGKYGYLTGLTKTGAAANTINNLKKNPALDYKVKNIPGWNDISTPEAAFGHTASALAIAMRDNPTLSPEDVYFKKYVTAPGSDTPERRAQFRKLMGTEQKIPDISQMLGTNVQKPLNVKTDESTPARHDPGFISNLIHLGLDNIKKSAQQFNPHGLVEMDPTTGKLKQNPEKIKELATTVIGSVGGTADLEKAGANVLNKVAPEIGERISGAISRLTESIKTATKGRAELSKIYTEELSKKASALEKIQATGPEGMAGYQEQLKSLKGELATPEQKSFKVENPIVEEDVQSLMKAAKLNPELDVFEKLNTQTALTKILGGVIPTPSELTLLGKTFGPQLVDEILAHKSTGSKILEGLEQVLNIPRSVMSSFDLSAPFRQGLALISHPKAFGSAFVNMFKQFGSETAFKAMQDSIQKMPEYGLMKQGKLALTDIGQGMTNREERFMSSWAEKMPGENIPVLGLGSKLYNKTAGQAVRASGRAYVGFLNKLRADVFTQIINGARAGGREIDQKLLSEVADFVNTASGRGSKILGVPIGQAGNILNGIFFSPRLMASRLTMLNPVSYVTDDPVVRKEMFKSLFTVLGAGMTTLGLAKLAGAKIGTNRNSSDFGKIIIGDTRIDIWGGFQQYVRMASQLQSGKYVSSVTGKESTLGEGFKALTKKDILYRQIESKEAPVLAFITDLLAQKDYRGKPINVPKRVAEMFVPMVIGDLYSLAKTNPELLPAGLLSIFGFGLQTYDKPSGGSKSNPLKQSKSGGLNSLKGLGL